MQSFFEKRATALDTSQPSIRHIQDLIRHKTPVAVQVPGLGELEGILHWQDIDYLALKQVGALLATHIPEDALKYGLAAVFIVFGLWILKPDSDEGLDRSNGSV
jgi:hypothetical protein